MDTLPDLSQLTDGSSRSDPPVDGGGARGLEEARGLRAHRNPRAGSSGVEGGATGSIVVVGTLSKIWPGACGPRSARGDRRRRNERGAGIYRSNAVPSLTPTSSAGAAALTVVENQDGSQASRSATNRPRPAAGGPAIEGRRSLNARWGPPGAVRPGPRHRHIGASPRPTCSGRRDRVAQPRSHHPRPGGRRWGHGSLSTYVNRRRIEDEESSRTVAAPDPEVSADLPARMNQPACFRGRGPRRHGGAITIGAVCDLLKADHPSVSISDPASRTSASL
jgi:hypothetical protein